MKNLTMLCLLFIGLNTTLQAQDQACEDKWKQIKKVNTSDTWKEKNTISSGKIYWKAIEYNNNDVYKLQKVASTGYYYVQDIAFDKMVYYTNEKDAIRALYMFKKCGIYAEQGKVK